jgi:hypothetical protein
MQNVKNRVINFLQNIATNPMVASRAVFRSLMIVGIIALVLDFGPRMMPQYFEARLVNPLDKTTWEKARTDFATQQTNIKSMKNARDCIANRIGGENSGYEKFLNDFEVSFAGVLPGAGNLLLEHPSTVNDRKEKLIFSAMQNYANKKFCIEPDQFKLVYLAEYKNVLGKLNVYFQARLYEKDPKKNPINKQNEIFINTFSEEFIFVEKDLISTQKYITNIIDRAIESAIRLDNQTQIRVANMTKQTNNVLLQTLVQQGNENLEISNSAASILEAMQKQDASENSYGGTTAKYKVEVYSGATKTPNIPAGSSEISKYENKIKSKVSFGLLSLLEPSQREDFFANHYAIEMSFYLAAKYSFDPLTLNGNALVKAIPQALRTTYDRQMDLLGAEKSINIKRIYAITESTITSSKKESSGANPPKATNQSLTPIPIERSINPISVKVIPH